MDGPPIHSAASYRARVLEVLETRGHPMTGREIARHSELTYKQTIDALNALFNLGKIMRNGRKFTAMWIPLQVVEPEPNPFALLEAAVKSWWGSNSPGREKLSR